MMHDICSPQLRLHPLSQLDCWNHVTEVHGNYSAFLRWTCDKNGPIDWSNRSHLATRGHHGITVRIYIVLALLIWFRLVYMLVWVQYYDVLI